MDQFRYLINQHLKSRNIFDENAPWVIEKSNLSGRGLFATRDIEPGEIIFKDNPLIIGPRASLKCPVICVNCYARTNLYACSRKCGLPVCSEICENSSAHKEECQIIARWKNGHDFSDLKIELLKCLTPVRTLLLSNDQKQLLRFLKAHVGPHHGFEVDILKDKLNLAISEEEENLMRLSCVVLDANSFEVTVGNEEHLASLRGLYPLSSLMNHSCVPNSMHIFDCNQNMISKATILIQKGEEIFDSYTRVYWGTSVRRPHLARTKSFYCMCARCEDPTEFGSNLSAIYCLKCQGLVLPIYVEKVKMIWKCTSCEEEMPSQKAGIVITALGTTLDSFKSSQPEEILNFLQLKVAKYLPPSSQIAVELKYRVMWIIGNQQKYLWQDLSTELLDEKEKICRELLHLLHILRVGKSKMRGLVLYELYACVRERQRRLNLQELDEKQQRALEEMSREMDGLFQESREILTDDVHAPDEIKHYNSLNKEKLIQNDEISLAG